MCRVKTIIVLNSLKVLSTPSYAILVLRRKSVALVDMVKMDSDQGLVYCDLQVSKGKCKKEGYWRLLTNECYTG
jgi:hypothetical protein